MSGATDPNDLPSPYDVAADDPGLRWRISDAAQMLTRHARLMWDERFPEQSLGPEWALAHSVRDWQAPRLDTFESSEGRRPDAIHVYRGRVAGGTFLAVFLEVDETIVTCYPGETVWDPAVRAYLRARHDQHAEVVDEPF